MLTSLRNFMRTWADYGPTAVAIRSGERTAYRLDLARGVAHPGFDGPYSPDVAVIPFQSGQVRKVLRLLPRGFASNLRVGQPVATMGYPAELSDRQDLAPIATFKDGTISALRPYQINDPGAPRLIVQHNLDLSKGTSGSAIFDVNGFVVAVNNAGIDRYVYDLESHFGCGWIPATSAGASASTRCGRWSTGSDHRLRSGARPPFSLPWRSTRRSRRTGTAPRCPPCSTTIESVRMRISADSGNASRPREGSVVAENSTFARWPPVAQPGCLQVMVVGEVMDEGRLVEAG